MTNDQKIAEFRQASLRFVVAITGGGSAFISDYLAIPGASSSLVEALVPYSRNATDAFLGKAPESYCSETTSRLIASAAFARARALEPDGDPDALLGIGATASLVADRPKKRETPRVLRRPFPARRFFRVPRTRRARAIARRRGARRRGFYSSNRALRGAET